MTDKETSPEIAEDEAEAVQPEDAEAPSTELVKPDFELSQILYVLPASERPYFPGQMMPVLLSETPWLETIEAIGDNPERTAGILLTKREVEGIPTPDDFFSMGTVVRIHEPQQASGMVRLVVEGLARFHVDEWLSDVPPLVARVDFPKSHSNEEDEDEVKAFGLALLNTIKELLPLNPLYGEELKMFLARFDPNDPSPFADFAANMTSAKREELQDVLETLPLLQRMEKVLLLAKKELDVAKIQTKIRESVQERMTEQQRTFFLRQQLEEIKRELGISKDDRTAELDRFKERLATLDPPEKAKARIDEEMDKLAILDVGSPEYGVTRNYLDWLTALPWGKHSTDKLDLKQARVILDRDHDGLDDVKTRIIEFLAVGTYRGEVGGTILLLVGPPGVGKTSIGKSVAEALGRSFYRFSLGGMRDEAEIKGHRRTYIGAMPGKFIQALKETQFVNPVIMLDEVDKVGASFRGDPASALLEVLDPEQNAEFHDHYLDVHFDLSKVLFVCTANQLDTIPGPLLDRMEAIHLAGYITAEKVTIARHHLWPKQLERAGVKGRRITITKAAVEKIVEGYAREAGVRTLEKQLARIVRKAVVKLLGDSKARVRIGDKDLVDYLGQPRFRPQQPSAGVGVVTGLAWTALGGATLDVEATVVHAKRRGFKQTGQLGDVMRESTEIAYSYVFSHVDGLGGKPGFFEEAFVHLHVPEGATPKDGPSAGITMATALLSLAKGRRVNRPLAMTGELTLTGKVLPIGGVREKVIAARRARIREILLPEANRRDFDELPDHLRDGMTAHFAKRFEDVAEIVFSPAPRRARKTRRRKRSLATATR